MKKFTVLITIALITATVGAALLPVAANAWSGGITGGASSARGADQPDDLFGDGGIFQTITNVMLFLVGAISVIMIIFGGIRYVISGGSADKVTSAKNTILYAIVGIIVALLAYAAVEFVINSLLSNGSGGGGGATSF